MKYTLNSTETKKKDKTIKVVQSHSQPCLKSMNLKRDSRKEIKDMKETDRLRFREINNERQRETE